MQPVTAGNADQALRRMAYGDWRLARWVAFQPPTDGGSRFRCTDKSQTVLFSLENVSL